LRTSQADAQGSGDQHHLAVCRHGAYLVDCFEQWHEGNIRRLEGNHHAVLAGVKCANRPGTVGKAELAVDRGRPAAARPGPDDRRVSLLRKLELQPIGDDLGRPAGLLYGMAGRPPLASGDKDA
jgi:hypothetical protein